MIANWIKLLLRSFLRFRRYAIINVAGLSLGIAAVIAIYVYVADELSYDRFHKDGERVYRINTISRFDGSENRYATTCAPLAEVVKPAVAAVDEVARMFGREASVQLIDSKTHTPSSDKFREVNVFLSDPSVFRVLSFNFLKGSGESALKDPASLVISRDVAVKYFGSPEAAIGREVLFEENRLLTITAVIENYPHQSHLRIELLAHFDLYFTEETPEVQQYLRSDWLYNPVSTYILLKPEAEPQSVETTLNELKNKFADDRVKSNVTYVLQPLHDIHLFSNFSFAENSNAINDVYLLASVGGLILLIACINFVNLSNVHSLKRAREIGVRKALGAQKQGLMIQFLLESAVFVMLSFVIAFGIVTTALPYVNVITGKYFTVADIFKGDLIIGMTVLIVFTIFLAGLYPSVYATRFRPAVVLKGIGSHKHSEGFLLRKSLLVFQFTVSTSLVVMSIIFYRQMEFIQDKALGFQRNHMLTIPLFSDTPNAILGGGVDGPLRSRMNSFEEQLLERPAIEAVTASSGLPGSGAVNALVQSETIKAEDNVFIAATAVDYDFVDTYKMTMVAGRNFSKSFGTDHLQAFIINEQAVKILGWGSPDDAIGKPIELLNKKGSVVGVVRDFHFQGLQQPLRPLILEVAAGKFNVFSIRLQSTEIPEMIEWIRGKWDNAFPEKVFEYQFLDERLDQNYGREQRLVAIMKFFSYLTIFISALGLFGLVAYINHLRAKEVSIRKVLGAQAIQIFYTLAKEFLRMAIIAVCIATPLTIFFSGQWLNTFAYRATVGLWPYLAGGVMITVTVLLTISYETVKSMQINPVDKLREE